MVRPGQQAAAHAGGPQQRPGFHGVHAPQFLKADLGATGVNHIPFLSAHHAGRASGQGQFRHGAQQHVRRQGRAAHDQKGVSQQAISGQNGRGLVESLVIGRLAAPQIVIVHSGQIVMDQGIGVDHLNGRGKGQGLVRLQTAKSMDSLRRGGMSRPSRHVAR